MLNFGKNILTLVLSEKNFLNETMESAHKRRHKQDRNGTAKSG